LPLTVINMVPLSLSAEIQCDSEPNLTVDPADPLTIVASAFTSDPGLSGNGPVYVSTDGGATWTLAVILPGGNRTADITVRFGGASHVLYAGILTASTFDLNILRKVDVTSAGLMDILIDRANEDQPYVEAGTAMGGAGAGTDRVFVPSNDFSAVPRTASVDQSLDAATGAAPAGFGPPARLDPRATSGQDGPSVRVAVHPQGRIYGAYFGWRVRTGSIRTSDIVVVRDDAWGTGPAPYGAITDPSDGLAGVLVATGVSIPWMARLGTQRVGSQLAIAVDPINPEIVYVAWAEGTFAADGITAATYTIHVRRSAMAGAAGSWSADLRTVSMATNPCLAVNSRGRVGFLYQQLVTVAGSNRWETHLETSDDGLGTVSDSVAGRQPDNAGPSYSGSLPIGDYAGLIAIGKDFYGVFSGNNTPDNANFPAGVTYQRYADFTTHQLFADAAHTTLVPISIDPFFLHGSDLAPEDDFYVRDWTDTPTSGDNGVEPSTHPVFFHTSDVWNRRGTLPGTFPNDQPENEPAGNGAGNIGDNWAFARIRRNVAGGATAQAVTAHFLVSKLGTGSSYVDAASMDPDVSFPDPDPIVTFNPADTGPLLTAPFHWHLAPVASTHLCLAVEVTGPNDPPTPPPLRGRAPGWPATDLAILWDNNKAQRNLGLSTTPARGVGLSDAFYAIVHNAATVRRDLELVIDVGPDVGQRFGEATVDVIGGKKRALRDGDRLVLEAMEPGENRWIGLTHRPPRGRAGEILSAGFLERANGRIINGFALGAVLAGSDEARRASIAQHHSVFTRWQAMVERPPIEGLAARARALLMTDDVGPKTHLRHLAAWLPIIGGELHDLTAGDDVFALRAALDSLGQAVREDASDGAIVAHTAFLNRLDAALTRRQLTEGDPADILLNVRWQRDLFEGTKPLAGLPCAKDFIDQSDRYIVAFGSYEVGPEAFGKLIAAGFECFEQAARLRRGRAREQERLLAALKEALASGKTAAIQRSHRALLLEFAAQYRVRGDS
jgi:hypothetical protein